MKKHILLFGIFFFSPFLFFSPSMVSGCEYDTSSNLVGALDNCLSDSELINPGDGRIESGVKNKIVYWTTQLAQLLGLLAVGAIVYGALLMTLSMGEDDKIKKGKDIVKWALLGFLALISAGALVRLVIELMFSFV